jgi:arylsulfatase A-like enzyme
MIPTAWFPHRRAFAVSALAQLALLVMHDIGRDPAGHRLQASPVVALGIQLPLYALPLLGGTAVWAALSRLVALRTISCVLGVAWTMVTLLLVTFDLGMQRFRAEPLSWNHIASYAGAGLANADWVQPVVEQSGVLAATLAILVGAGVALVRGPCPEGRVPQRREPLLWALAIPLVWAPTQLAWYHQRDLLQPPTLRLWQTRRPPAPWDPAEERFTRDALRRALDPQGHDVWLSDQYPLLRRPGMPGNSPAWARAVDDPPDIVVVAIESLRGRDTGWGYGGRVGADSPTPRLDTLAAQSVRYPLWMAGGEPSPRGFITLHTGVWEHPQLFIAANFPDLHVDAFPAFLRRRGYSAVALWSASPGFDNQLGMARRWYDETLFDREEAQQLYFEAVPDSVTVERAMHWIRAHDQDVSTRPFVLYLATNGTHTPFPVPDGESDPGTRQGRYDLTLRKTDHEVGRLLTALRARARWTNTVVLVVGDHGERTDDDANPVLRGLPTDPMVLTSALLFGPPALVGVPRVNAQSVGHADWFATVRSWFADTSAGVWMGRDLFDTATTPRWAVAVNSRGYRQQDHNGASVVSATDSTRRWAWRPGTPAEVQQGPAPAGRSLTAWLRFWGALVESDRVLPPESLR